MEIQGLNKTTLLDYPEHVAATLFTGGCNFRCPFCHNGDLVLGYQQIPVISMEEVWSFLQKRQGLLEGVCITGGEPTLQPDLIDFIREIKELGYLVKLDTNGYQPRVLKKLLEQSLLDYVAMDIKAAKGNYPKAIGWVKQETFQTERLQESIDMLMQGQIPYEFRTTVVKGIHTMEEFREIGSWLQGARAYYLQGYQENEKELQRVSLAAGEESQCYSTFSMEYSAFSMKEMKEIQAVMLKYIPIVGIRGMD